MTTVDAGAIELGGRIGSGILGWGGRIVGGLFGGPAGAVVGGYLGSRAGQWVGKAATGALLNAMEDANEDAEELSEEDATTACAECGEVACFNPPAGVSPEEFRRQLEEQQNALREMDPNDIVNNIDNYARPNSDAADRRRARQDYFDENIDALTDEIAERDQISREEAAGRASDELLDRMSDLDATHIVDLIAGGSGAISGLGNRSVNRSIGSQWGKRGLNRTKTRSQELRDYADKARQAGKDMSGLELKICGEEGTEGEAPPSGGGPGNPASGPQSSGPPPTS